MDFERACMTPAEGSDRIRRDARRVEHFLDCDGFFAAEEEAVMVATARARARMPEQAET